jgi:hypothetical protein
VLCQFSRRIFLSVALSGFAALSAATLLPVHPAWAAGCPNEVLRTELHSGQLPECRAYELVSPKYGDSAILTGVFAVSSDGSHLIGSSLGAFAGTKGDAIGNGTPLPGAVYEYSREGSGWVATSLDPPYSQFVGNGIFDVSSDLSSTLWELSKHKVSTAGAPPDETQCPAESKEEEEDDEPASVTDLYLEKPVGVFTKIGPATPGPCEANGNDYTYLGASADLTSILFRTSPGFHWPFDDTRTSGETLYEYSGVEQPSEGGIEQAGEPEPGEPRRKPMLVGVNGGRNSRNLISHCGTRLGSREEVEESRGKVEGSTYNAISTNGRRVIFTAVGTDEASGCEGPPAGSLFVREEFEEGSSAILNMRTIDLSASECDGDPECLVAPPGDAHFEGASQDGSKVFFTSTQKLVPIAAEDQEVGDSAGGSGCARTTVTTSGCNLYEIELETHGNNRLVAISGGVTNPQVQGVARISEDGSHIYFVAHGVLTGEAANERGEKALAGADNLYVYQRDPEYPEGHLSFIARLSVDDAPDWSRVDNRPVLTSESGDILIFTSAEDLTDEGLATGKSQVFQYNAKTETLVRASIGEDGYGNNDRTPEIGSSLKNGFLSAYSYANADSPTERAGIQAPGDGVVFFDSPDALTFGALDDQHDSLGQMVPNIYEYRAGRVYLLSDGHDVSAVNDTSGAELVGWDPSGDNVFFSTSDSLILSDTNTQQNLYDARVEGGFPTAIQAPSCEGETCQGLLAGIPPLVPSSGSSVQAAEASPQSTPVSTPTDHKATTHKTKNKISKHSHAKKKRRRGRSVGVRMRRRRAQ